jgi:hypothetical protein
LTIPLLGEQHLPNYQYCASYVSLRSLTQGGKMVHHRSYFCAVFGLVTALAISSARADSIFSNLGIGNGYNTSTFNVVRGATSEPPFGSADQANAFTVGPTDYVFTSAQLALDYCGGGVLHGCGGTNEVDILLLSNTSDNLPGTVLQTIRLTGIPDIGYPSSGALVTAKAVAPLTLKAGTTYWLGATVLAPDSYFAWFVNNTGDHLFAIRQNGGAWNPPSYPLAAAGAFQIDGTPVSPVPEPSGLLLIGTGLLGVVGAVRRKLLG